MQLQRGHTPSFFTFHDSSIPVTPDSLQNLWTPLLFSYPLNFDEMHIECRILLHYRIIILDKLSCTLISYLNAPIIFARALYIYR